MSFYLDASAILPTLIVEPTSIAVTRFLSETDHTLIVSEFAAAEVASALSRLTRMGSLDRDQAMSHLSDLDMWRSAFTENIDFSPSDVRLASQFVRRFDLTLRAPDALHAALCRRGDHVLMTLDKRLAAAATRLGLQVECLD